MGSNMEVKNAPDDNTDNVMDTLETLIAPKKAIQSLF